MSWLQMMIKLIRTSCNLVLGVYLYVQCSLQALASHVIIGMQLYQYQNPSRNRVFVVNPMFTLTRAQSRKRARRAADLAAKQPCHEVHVTTWLGWIQCWRNLMLTKMHGAFCVKIQNKKRMYLRQPEPWYYQPNFDVSVRPATHF